MARVAEAAVYGAATMVLRAGSPPDGQERAHLHGRPATQRSGGTEEAGGGEPPRELGEARRGRRAQSYRDVADSAGSERPGREARPGPEACPDAGAGPGTVSRPDSEGRRSEGTA